MFNPENFKENGLMYGLALAVVVFVTVQSLFFIIKSWKRGREIGLDKSTLMNTVTSSILFTIAPAISILVTVIALANALGIVLPWIRLTVIGNLAYETVAAESALSQFSATLNSEVTDPKQFSTIAWAMTIGASFPLTFLPLVCKKLQKKIGSVATKDEKTSKLADVLAASAFIGIISSFIARAINGCTVQTQTVYDEAGNAVLDEAGNFVTEKVITESAGLLSILTLVFAIIFMLVLIYLCNHVKALEKLEPFAMPIAMFAAMGMAILFNSILPDDLLTFRWPWYDDGGIIGMITSGGAAQ